MCARQKKRKKHPDLSCQNRVVLSFQSTRVLRRRMATVMHDRHGTRDECIHTGDGSGSLTTRGSFTFPSCSIFKPVHTIFACVSACVRACGNNLKKQNVYRPFQQKNTGRKWHSEWRQSAQTKGESKAEIAPALHTTCDQAHPVNNTQQLVHVTARVMDGARPAATGRSEETGMPTTSDTKAHNATRSASE